jgi:hypothetical protein
MNSSKQVMDLLVEEVKDSPDLRAFTINLDREVDQAREEVPKTRSVTFLKNSRNSLDKADPMDRLEAHAEVLSNKLRGKT